MTGAAGFLGRHVAAACVAAGHRVVGVDSAPQPPGWEAVTADLCDLGATVQAFDGAEAVAHCAAIPRPVGRTASEVFRVNMATIHAATEAARIVGAGVFVQASSFSILGYPFAPAIPVPARLPIDESVPAAPQDVYGLTKWLAEEVVEAAVRRGDFRAASLRMPWIQTAATFGAEIGPRRETPGAAADLWAYLDARDAGDAFVAALDRGGAGHLRCFLSAADSYSDRPSRDLVTTAFGADVQMAPGFTGHASLISTGLARAALGFVPCRSWRDYAGEGQGG
ncbi:MAG: NAD(P)-dependent oxidoreductase [Rubellimicrobium sp.]|nr:NAD(P)-dependent oxidoreductase [Rubellimicrobium sp.]